MRTPEEWRDIIATWSRRPDGLPSDAEIEAIQQDAIRASTAPARAADLPANTAHNNPNAGIVPAYPKGRWS